MQGGGAVETIRWMLRYPALTERFPLFEAGAGLDTVLGSQNKPAVNHNTAAVFSPVKH